MHVCFVHGSLAVDTWTLREYIHVGVVGDTHTQVTFHCDHQTPNIYLRPCGCNVNLVILPPSPPSSRCPLSSCWGCPDHTPSLILSGSPSPSPPPMFNTLSTFIHTLCFSYMNSPSYVVSYSYQFLALGCAQCLQHTAVTASSTSLCFLPAGGSG